jgi:hypothetical protein
VRTLSAPESAAEEQIGKRVLLMLFLCLRHNLRIRDARSGSTVALRQPCNGAQLAG